MRLADRPVRELMTPRTELDWIDLHAERGRDPRQRSPQAPHSLLPVADGSPDKIVGVVKVREVLALMLAGPPGRSRRADEEAPRSIPDQLDAMDALRMLQAAEVAMAMVHDEYGHLEGDRHPGRPAVGDRRQLRQPPGRGRRADDRRARGRIAADLGRAAGRCAGRPAGHRPARRPRIRDRRGLCAVDAQEAARGRRALRPTRAGGSRWSTWTGARSTSCWSSVCERPSGRSSSGCSFAALRSRCGRAVALRLVAARGSRRY